MKRIIVVLLSVLAVVGYVKADMIQYTTYDGVSVSQSGRHIDMFGSILVPGFDTQLGDMYSVFFDVSLGGNLYWETLSRARWGVTFTDFDVRVAMTVLGTSYLHYESPVMGWGGLPCGTLEFPVSCGTTRSYLTDGAGVRTVASVMSGMDGLSGQGMISVPVSFSIDATPWNSNGVVIGDLFGQQPLRVDLLDWKYSYTPPITATPEPSYTLILCLLLVGVVYIRNCTEAKAKP